MSFRKRNVGLSRTQAGTENLASRTHSKTRLPGVRPSAIDGRSTTSTGTATLDSLLAGHAGLPLGASLLIEESGNTDYAGVLLRLYAAEGLVQGHYVHVIGLPEQWGRELPAVIHGQGIPKKQLEPTERMKIAWRYERLGQFGGEIAGRDRNSSVTSTESAEPAQSNEEQVEVFCHVFDLMKRLVHPTNARMSFIMIDLDQAKSPFEAVMSQLTSLIAKSTSDTVHRIVIPSLLSPALYPPHASMPSLVLQFQHQLRALLAQYMGRLTVMQSLPLSLYPRLSGLTRWIELLNDGIIEIAPFPHSSSAEMSVLQDSTNTDELPQGLFRIHRSPIFHDRYSGTVPSEHDWTFTLSRRKFTIRPFALPPIEGDTDVQVAAGGEQKPTKADLEF